MKLDGSTVFSILRWLVALGFVAAGCAVMFAPQTNAIRGGRAGAALIAIGFVIMLFGGRSVAEQRGYRDG